MTNDVPEKKPPEQRDDFPAVREKRRYISGVWILPIIAALVVGYLAIRSYDEHGPDITITFKSAEGLSAGQTQLKYKAVTLGTVNNIQLKPDMSGVIVHITTTADARNLLTDQTQFWVVRPQINASNISDIQLLVSGTYIQLEPGEEEGNKSETSFTGLEQPPDIRSDEPGRVYLLKAEKLGSLSVGSPIYYRDISVGQVISYDIGNGYGPITLSILVRDPYAKYIHNDSRFWNVSGINITLAGGLHLEFQSIQALLSGGVSFYTPDSAINQPQAEAKTTFTLFDRKQTAVMADGQRLDCVSYFQSPIKDLATGSPIEIYGVRVGEVTDVKLVFDQAQNQSRIRVAFVVKPNLAFGSDVNKDDGAKIMRDLLQKGMRATLESSDLIVGQQIVSLEFTPQAQPAEAVMEGDALIVPGAAGGIGNITDALGDIASKLNQIPFQEIGDHLNHLLASADQNFGGPEMKQAVHDLADTLANAQKISQSANENLTPALKKLPDISNQLQSTMTHANAFMSSVDAGYGEDSDFHHSVKRVMGEVNDAARSIRLLADFLDRHPEALLTGKSGDTETIQKDKQ